MANFSALKTAIQNAIKQNGNEEITGDVLQQILLSIVSTMGDGSINTIEQNLSNESTTRQGADTQLQNAINAIKANIDNGYVYAGLATPLTTPVSGKVFYIATAAGTYTNFGGQVLTQGINILRYNGSAWSNQQLIGIDDVPTAGSNNLIKSGGVQNELALCAVFDVSAKNPTAGPNNDGKWESLAALLSDANLNTLIPTAYRKGGMSIKFVHTSDNKYVQYRLMSDSFNTTPSNWQGVDDEPTSGSNNLVTSGGVRQSIDEIVAYIGKKCDNVEFIPITNGYSGRGLALPDCNIGDTFNESLISNCNSQSLAKVDVADKKTLVINNLRNSSSNYYTWFFIDSNGILINGSINPRGSAPINYALKIPNNAIYAYVSYRYNLLPEIFVCDDDVLPNKIVDYIESLNIQDVTSVADKQTKITLALKYSNEEAQTIDTIDIPSVTDEQAGLMPAKDTWDEQPTPESGNPISSGAVAKVTGRYVDNPEWKDVVVNANGIILYGLKVNGNVYYGLDVPQSIINIIEEETSELIEEYAKKASTIEEDCLPIRIMIMDKYPQYFKEYEWQESGDDIPAPTSFEQDAYLDRKIRNIPDGKHFIFVTDTHWNNNIKHSNILMSYVKKKLGIPKVLFGGDAITKADENKYLAAQKLSDYADELFSAFGKSVVYAQGNHDGNWLGRGEDSELYLDYLIPDTEVYKRTVQRLEGLMHFDNLCIQGARTTAAFEGDRDNVESWVKLHYYIDDDVNKVRYIVVETGNRGHTITKYSTSGVDYAVASQYNFLKESLLGTPDDYDIVVVGHEFDTPYKNDYWGARRMLIMLSDFKGRRAGSLSQGYFASSITGLRSVDYDFTNVQHTGKVLVISGHFHVDGGFIWQTTDGTWGDNIYSDELILADDAILNIWTDCDTNQNASSYNSEDNTYHWGKTEGTTAEQGFDVVTITDNQIVCTRFGAGEDRVFNY